MSERKSATQRVQDAANAACIEIVVRELSQSTRTAEEAANACGCGISQIVKSLVFQGRDTQQPVLLLVSGANRVDEKAVASDIGERLTRPNAEYVRETTGYAIGGVPPIGHPIVIATFMDRDLLAHEFIWAAAGTPNSLFSVTPGALRTATKATVISMS